MRAAANCTVSILRGTTTDTYGDEVDTLTAVQTGVVAWIFEQNRRVYLPAEAAYRIVRTYAGRVGAEVDIRKDDRVKNEQTNAVYLVTDIADSGSAAHRPDIVLQLSRTT